MDFQGGEMSLLALDRDNKNQSKVIELDVEQAN